MSTTTDFDRLARVWLDEGPTTMSDRALEAALQEVHVTRQRRALRAPWRVLNMPALSRASAVAAIALAVLVGGGTIWYVGQRADPSPSAVPSATQSPERSRSGLEGVMGWPTTSSNAKGLYSWGSGSCGFGGPGQSCVYGFMHNGYGSGNVAITFRVDAEQPVSAGATAATIAGHSGVYRRVIEPDPSAAIADLPRFEEWNVDIDGVSVAITLYARPGTPDADLAEARAIVQSIRYEPEANPLGFRLVFTIATASWDSG